MKTMKTKKKTKTYSKGGKLTYMGGGMAKGMSKDMDTYAKGGIIQYD